MLPKIIAPEHDLKLFSLKKPIKFRPYLVKEEKLFLTAQQSGDTKDVENAVKQVAKNCTFDKVNIDALPSFDLEYLFLQLRARSVSNRVDVSFVCHNAVTSTTGEGECGATVPCPVNLDDVKLIIPEGHTDTFMLTDDIGVTMRYPTTDILTPLGEDPDIISLLSACIATVFTKDGDVTEVSEQPKEQVLDFVGGLTLAQTDKLRAFFDTMPRLEYKLQFVCPKCGHTEEVTLSGLLDFFD